MVILGLGNRLDLPTMRVTVSKFWAQSTATNAQNYLYGSLWLPSFQSITFSISDVLPSKKTLGVGENREGLFRGEQGGECPCGRRIYFFMVEVIAPDNGGATKNSND
jgi:hypothetical protein